MIKPIEDFVKRFNAKITLNEYSIVEKQERYFLLTENLKELLKKDFFYAGAYLGKIRKGKFFPSFITLSIIAEADANKVIVDKKTEWLFICGRDVFGRGITGVIGSLKKGDYTLVINLHGECLGFGKMLRRLEEEKGNVVVKNILDIGDFLRREKQRDSAI
jgi:ribosome biogenesis protein Nip4